MDQPPTRLCRDCGFQDSPEATADPACPTCESPRTIRHPELASLHIAHVDCDAYYASVEKRDRPELAELPVIVGGGQRGVVTTCCYIARRYGVRSAMPMARAIQLCPHATVLRPDMEKYQRESRRIGELMRTVTPAVEQVSIDEAYLDLEHATTAGSEPAARALARLSLLIERRVGVTVSIGLAPNKMLAKLASDLGKPRGFAVIGQSDALTVIGPLKISVLPGVGPVAAGRLEELGLRQVSDLWTAKEADLIHRFGLWGRRLIAFSRAIDERKVATSRGRAVTIGAETTFERDLRRLEEIDPILGRLCGQVAAGLAKRDLAASGLTLKLRRADRQTITRACRLQDPTMRSEIIWHAARQALAREIDGAAYRLVGVTANRLVSGQSADPPDLFAAQESEVNQDQIGG